MNHVRAHIRFQTQIDALNLVNALSQFPDSFRLENFSGDRKASAKSIIGVMYMMFDHADDTFIVNETTDGFFPAAIDQYRVL